MIKLYKHKIQVKPDEFLSNFAEQQNVEDFMAFLKSQPKILKNKYAKAEKFIKKRKVSKNELIQNNKQTETTFFIPNMPILFALIIVLKLVVFSFFFIFNLIDSIRRNSSSWAFQHLFFGVFWLFLLILAYFEMKILATNVQIYSKLPWLIVIVSIIPTFFGDAITTAFACSQFICIVLVTLEGWLFFKMR